MAYLAFNQLSSVTSLHLVRLDTVGDGSQLCNHAPKVPSADAHKAPKQQS